MISETGASLKRLLSTQCLGPASLSAFSGPAVLVVHAEILNWRNSYSATEKLFNSFKPGFDFESLLSHVSSTSLVQPALLR